MSRKTVLLLVVLCTGVAGLIALSKMRSGKDAPDALTQSAPVEPPAPSVGSTRPVPPVVPPSGNTLTPPPNVSPSLNVAANTVTTAPNAGASTIAKVGSAVPPGQGIIVTTANELPTLTPELKPLPVLEKEYAATTDREARLDLIMDISENSSADAVKALTRLFELETDTDLRVDLLDTLLGIDGFKDEKLIMLTLGARQGLPPDVRQAAIDGLIDLDDQRVVPILNGLLNDPDPEIREGAQDALEMIQAQPEKK
jgi:hypothetical protein